MTDAAAPELDRRDIRRRQSLVASTFLSLMGRKGALLGAFWVVVTGFFASFAPFIANSRPFAWYIIDDAYAGGGHWAFPLFEYLTPQDVMFSVGFLLAAVCFACYRSGARAFWFWLAAMCAVFLGSMFFVTLASHGESAGAIDTAIEKLAADPDSAILEEGLSKATRGYLIWWVIRVPIWMIVVGLMGMSLYMLRRNLPWLIAASAVSAVVIACLLSPQLRIEPPRGQDIADYESYRVALSEGRARDAWFAPIPYSPNDTMLDQAATDMNEIGVNNRSRPPGAHPTTADIAEDIQLKTSSIYGVSEVRLYNLVDENGDPVPSPTTLEEARAVTELMWQTYQQTDAYNPVAGRQKHASALAMQAGMEAIEPGTRYHVMGTTASGQDLASRMVHGSRVALYIGFISTSIAVVIGVIIGGLLGYFAGWVDLIGLRFVEIFASIPVIMLLIMIVAFYERSLVLMMVVLGLTGWVGYAYFVRAEFLKLRKMDYVMAARASGTPLHLILFRHMLPNGVAPVLVGASFGIAGAIMTEATLSFLGLGLEDSESSWGQMLDQARTTGKFAWWLAIWPGLAIFLTVFAYNLIGEALRDVIDPRAVK